MKVLYLSAEITPLAKAGGLGDVAGALPKALKELGVDIRLAMPYYGCVSATEKTKKILGKIILFNRQKHTIEIWKTLLPKTKIPVYLLKHRYFNNRLIYTGTRKHKGEKYTRRYDDLLRFAFFNKVMIQLLDDIAFRPDIIHCNDWHSGLSAHYINETGKSQKTGSNAKIVYTIHNLANQGMSPSRIIDTACLPAESKSIIDDSKDGDINFMVQGILNSDAVTTVSPTYAKEIVTRRNGAGLDNVLNKRKNCLSGILNGIDTDFFNPEKDKLIAKRYSLLNLKLKAVNKMALQKKLGLTVDGKTAMIGVVSRLVRQKGFDLVTKEMMKLNAQLVVLGQGEREIERKFKELKKEFPDSVSVQIGFDERLAHEIYAASDMFLMPSRFEPCGLGQMIAMRYGSLPIVRRTGGLADTVSEDIGFVFDGYDKNELKKKLVEAVGLYRNDPKEWKKRQLKAMKKDFSWKKSAELYLKLYKKIVSE